MLLGGKYPKHLITSGIKIKKADLMTGQNLWRSVGLV